MEREEETDPLVHAREPEQQAAILKDPVVLTMSAVIALVHVDVVNVLIRAKIAIGIEHLIRPPGAENAEETVRVAQSIGDADLHLVLNVIIRTGDVEGEMVHETAVEQRLANIVQRQPGSTLRKGSRPNGRSRTAWRTG